MRKPQASKARRREPLSAKARAVELLTRREHGARELKRKLIAKGLEAEAAGAAVDELAAEGWQSDLRYAQAITRSRARQGYGPRRIAYELAQAGVDVATVDEAIRLEDCDWHAIAQDWVQRKHAEPPEDAAAIARVRRKLHGRGFDEQTVRAVIASEDAPPA
ncbi:MAG: regulatory protein RecX [Algiphilus sp.]